MDYFPQPLLLQGRKADINPQSPLFQDSGSVWNKQREGRTEELDWILSFIYPCPSGTAYPLTLEQWGLLAQLAQGSQRLRPSDCISPSPRDSMFSRMGGGHHKSCTGQLWMSLLSWLLGKPVATGAQSPARHPARTSWCGQGLFLPSPNPCSSLSQITQAPRFLGPWLLLLPWSQLNRLPPSDFLSSKSLTTAGKYSPSRRTWVFYETHLDAWYAPPSLPHHTCEAPLPVS